MEQHSEDRKITEVKNAFRKMFGEDLIDIEVTAEEKVFKVRLHLKN